MVIAAIEEKYDIDLPHFDVEPDEEDEDDDSTPEQAAFCQSILDDHAARQVQISAPEFVPLAMVGGIPRDVARRRLEEKFDTAWDWPDDKEEAA